MHRAPTQAELMRFVEGVLPTGRAKEIEREVAADESLAQEVEAIRADLRLAEEVKLVGRTDLDAESEQRMTRMLTSSVMDSVRHETS